MEYLDLLHALDQCLRTGSVERIDASTGPAAPVATHINRLLDDLLAERAANAALQLKLQEQERIQADLEAARDQALEASRLKSQFLASMSHELRTPLNAIIGYSELLQEELGPEATADLGTIHAAGKHLLILINDVLDLAKIEAGKLEIYCETVEVAPVFQDVVRTVQPLIAKRRNTLVVEAPDGLGIMCTDATRLKQCLLNLLSNAAKFTEDSVITLAVKPEEVAGQSWLAFHVIDRGVGLTEEQMGRLFQPFEQAGGARQDGTGLGLTISRRFSQMLGGDISVQSVPGAGSTFTVRLPREQAGLSVTPNLAPRPAEPPALVAGQPTVLVIDDDPHVRELMRRYLASEGWNTLGAATGAEGLALARSARPTAITLDVIMPGMDGWTVLTELQADPALKSIPVVMVTIVDDRQTGYALGAVQMLSKPIERSALRKTLARIPHSRHGSVLIVDDDEAARGIYRRMLESEGCSVREAADGRLALERLREARPNLILLDLLMPELDGFELVRELQKDPAWRDIPAIAVTAGDLRQEDRQRLTAGVQSILTKDPDQHSSLLANVRDLLRASTARPSAADDGDVPHVLVVDDNAVNRRLAVRMLERLGYAAATAASGEEAVETARRGKFALVLMDLEMPGMDGLAAARLLRSEGLTAPIVAMTGYGEDERRMACQAAGMNDFVGKPIDPGEFAATLERCLAMNTAR